MPSAYTYKKKYFFFAIIISLLFLWKPEIIHAAGPLVWLEDGMTRVFKNDPAKSASTITLYTAKNEYEPFQIIVKSPAANSLTNVNVSLSALTGPGGATINTDKITLYREHYLFVTAGSKKRAGDTNNPLGPGWYPDALIPFTDPVTRLDLTARLDAAPFTVAASENQPVWVDIFTPANTPAGLYNGTVTVTSGQGTATVSVSLNVWNFTLPAKRSLKGYTNTFGSYRTRESAIEILKHRLNPKVVSRSDERFLIDNYALDMIDVGRTSGAGYGNCTASPAPPVSEVATEVANHEKDLYLLTSYANEVWDCTNLTSTFLAWAQAIRQGGSHPMIVTYPSDALMGPDLNHTAADIWSFLPKHYDIAKTNLQKLVSQPGIQVWAYNPLVQDGFSPKFTVDFLPINSRIMQGFINQSLGFTGSKFWRVDNWTVDPWSNAEATRTDVPGEGHMAYPGADVGLSKQVIAGVRLKWYREGSEDFEYIQMLKNAGQSQFALQTVHTVATDFRTWTQDKNVLLSARKTLGDKLSGQIVNTSPSPTGAISDCRANPARLTCFEAWRLSFTTGVYSADADMNGSGTVTMADFEVWRRAYAVSL